MRSRRMSTEGTLQKRCPSSHSPRRASAAPVGTRDEVGRATCGRLQPARAERGRAQARGDPRRPLPRTPTWPRCARRGSSRSRRTASQKRESGEPYVSHPLAAARILAELGLDPEAIIAALLHDIPEDTDYSLADIEERFGPDVARLVDGVTKLSKFGARSHEEQQAENIRKMLLAMAEDIRVVLIKLADRLHNMRTIGALSAEKQQRIARQTAEIYAPLAERLGIWQIKWELEDLSFKVLEPGAYRRLADQLETQRRAREAYVQARAGRARVTRWSTPGIKAELSGRPKHISSIWKKMQRKSADFDEIYDVHALRVLVDEVADCYAALGVVHSHLAADPGQFDDYIAVPKANVYQCLHTAVIALDGKPLEVQIRTHAMHRVAEVGIAAHWRYKDGGSRFDQDYDAKLAWVRQLMDWQREVSDATEFVEGLKLDLFQDQVFVFTPTRRRQGPAGRLDAARLRLPHPHRRGPLVHRRQGQQPPRAARLQAQERRHRRDRHHQGRPRAVARLAEDRPDRPRQGKDPRSGSSARSATRTSSTAANRSSASCAAWRARRSRSWAPSGSSRWPTQYRYQSVDDFFAAIGYGAVSAQHGRHQARCGRRCQRAGPAADRAAHAGTRRGRYPCQGRRRPDDPLRALLPSHPG